MTAYRMPDKAVQGLRATKRTRDARPYGYGHPIRHDPP